MSCASVRECLQEHLEGTRHPLELAGKLPDWAQRHLESCNDCREACWELVALEGSLRSLGEVGSPPADLTASVMARLSLAPAPVAARQDWRWMWAAMLMGACFYGMTWLVEVPANSSAWLAEWVPDLSGLAWRDLNEPLLLTVAAAAWLGAIALNWRWRGA